ncbi:hypothetical protein SAURM35S_07307 [Streptomyces aurantiogriseus]
MGSAAKDGSTNADTAWVPRQVTVDGKDYVRTLTEGALTTEVKGTTLTLSTDDGNQVRLSRT